MYVKSSTRHTARGPVRYLQLAHNEWGAATKTSRPKVLYSFGREDSLDRAVIERLVASLCRLLDPGPSFGRGHLAPVVTAEWFIAAHGP